VTPTQRNERTALVLGATGLVGSAVVRHLLDDPDYGEIRVLARREYGSDNPRLKVTVADPVTLSAQGHLFRVSDVFCCLGTTIRKAGSQDAFRFVDYTLPLEAGILTGENGGLNFLLITSIGANPRSKVFYTRVKGEIEEAVSKLPVPGIHIFRPSMLLGKREEVRPGEVFGGIAMRIGALFMRGKWKKYRPIKAETVARALIWVAKQQVGGFRIYESDTIEDLGHR
jgi:uncharacterized protein YbjT (DUF2867 family)